MTDFMMRFLICNLFISGVTGILSLIKRISKNHLTSRMQYNIWFLLLGLLCVPFLPIRPVSLFQIFSWIRSIKSASVPDAGGIMDMPSPLNSTSTNQINDFALSVSRETPATVGLVLCGLWIAGIFAMIALLIKSRVRLNTIKKSALPLQSEKVWVLYSNCLNELKIKTNIPIYSTAFLKSPVIVGVRKPCIYLPIHLISDYNAKDMRYMLLHELQHYRHKDALANYVMNLAGVLYWFNPFVWYALKEMRNDREVACDTSVLNMLEETDYKDYGNTLIDFAEKVSLTPFPFATGISGNMKQMQRRIINIASYKKASAKMSVWKKIKDILAFIVIASILFSLAPILSTHAADHNNYQWNIPSEKVSILNLSTYFDGYEGSFVLYDPDNDIWNIYNMDHATLRTAPSSTYKIYDALFGLEEGVIAPENSFIAWDKTKYPFEAWEADQDLNSAMQFSVNWYFHAIDKQLGQSTVKRYIETIEYGNEDVDADLSSYWMESSLQISPVEQVTLLTKLYNNDFHFAPENVAAVKKSIFLSSSEKGNFYGKTGTGRINDQDVNGWFIGFVEQSGHTWFFAVNIASDSNATGSIAAEIARSILSSMAIWV